MSAFLKIIPFGQLTCFACTLANEVFAHFSARLIGIVLSQSLRAAPPYRTMQYNRKIVAFFKIFSVSFWQITIRTELSLLDVACLLAQDKSNRNRWLLWHIGVD